jgi:integrase
VKKPTNRLLFSQKAIEKLPTPKAGRVHYYDTKVCDLGLRVEHSGRKSFFWLKKVRGRPTFRSIGVFPNTSVEQGRGRAHELSGQLDVLKRNSFKGENPFERPQGEPTLQELLGRYIELWVRKQAAHPEKAEQDARWMFGKYLSSWRGRKLGEITRQNIRELHDKLSRENGAIAADRVVQLVRRLYNWAGDEEVELWKGENPAVKIALNGDNERDRFLQPDELVRLDRALKQEPNADLADFVTLCLATGARRGNVLAMEWTQLDTAHWTWTIPRSSSKNRKPMILALTSRAVAVLKRRARLRTTSPFVFPSHNSASGHLVEMKKPWKRLLARAQITDCVMHDLRRTNASYQSIGGQSLQVIAATLGHSSTASTEIYARLNTEAARKSLLAGQRTMEKAMLTARKQRKPVPAVNEQREVSS